jgi:ATP-binding cassette subfamily B protein
MSADNIMYMQDGKILDQGPHEKLLETCEPYRTLAEMEGSANNEPS